MARLRGIPHPRVGVCSVGSTELVFCFFCLILVLLRVMLRKINECVCVRARACVHVCVCVNR